MTNQSANDVDCFSDFDDYQSQKEERSKNKHGSRYDAETRRKIDEKLERRRLKKELGYYDN